MTEWREIPGFSPYIVSSTGQVARVLKGHLAKLNPETVKAIRAVSGSLIEIARQFGVSRRTVARVRRRERKGGWQEY